MDTQAWTIAAGLALLAAAGPAAGQKTTRASLGPRGAQGDFESLYASLSYDGRFVAFYSDATTLVPGDENGMGDVFVRDRWLLRTVLASVDSSGTQGNGESEEPQISADGRFVVFSSDASNLVPGDTNATQDVFVRDLENGVTERVSVDSSGLQAAGMSYGADVSGDGRFVAFTSVAPNLVPGDTNGRADVFVRDRVALTTTRVSLGSSGSQANQTSEFPSISTDGQMIEFQSLASNLVAGDTNAAWDIFVRDRLNGTTVRASVDSSGTQANASSSYGRLSGNGRFVSFTSFATNLVLLDTNADNDVFVHDLLGGSTVLASVSTGGEQVNGYTTKSAISADGRYVAYKSSADNQVADDTNGLPDIFLRDVLVGTTVRVSVSSSGAQANGTSSYPGISGNGKHVGFYSAATNLVPRDTNGEYDVFVHSRTKVRRR